MVRHRQDRPGGSDGPSAVDITSAEQTPLLGRDPDQTGDELQNQRDQLRVKVTILCLILVFILELGVGMSGAPTSEIMEAIICRHMHPELANGELTIPWGQGDGDPNDPCKSDDVQNYLALLRGWSATFEAIPGLLTAIPFGILSDRWGRKPVLLLGISGLTMSLAFNILVFLFSDLIPIWVTWFGALFMFLGGGGQMVVAMLYTFLADVIPVAERATAFFHAGAVFLLSAMVSAPLSGAIMVKSPWMALILSTGILALGIPTVMVFPETMHLHGPQGRTSHRQDSEGPVDGNDGDDEREEEDGFTTSVKLSVFQVLWQKAREGILEVGDFVLSNKSLVFLMLSTMFVVLGKFVQEMLLQYATKRYGWTWSRATVVLFIRGAASMVTYLVVLPFASWFCLTHLGMSGISKDIWLARISGAVSIVGCLVIAMAPNGYVLASGVVWLSLGAGIGQLTRSLLNSLVEEHHVGTVNSLVGFMEMSGLMVSGPLFAESWRLGMKWGGSWIGLPFFTTALFLTIATTIVVVFRPPASRRSRR